MSVSLCRDRCYDRDTVESFSNFVRGKVSTSDTTGLTSLLAFALGPDLSRASGSPGTSWCVSWCVRRKLGPFLCPIISSSSLSHTGPGKLGSFPSLRSLLTLAASILRSTRDSPNNSWTTRALDRRARELGLSNLADEIKCVYTFVCGRIAIFLMWRVLSTRVISQRVDSLSFFSSLRRTVSMYVS